MEAFGKLALWLDPLERAGPEAMAVDEWLLETAVMPVLRVYRWLGEWGSVGYFGELGEAMTAVPGVRWVRRWTGGGTVDHRADWTYSVVAPAAEMLAGQRGAESYRILHAALAAALAAEGIDARLSSGADSSGATLCFANPVSHDLIDPGGRKLAGAGQRRTRHGLLHQGSAAVPAGGADCRRRAEALAGTLANDWSALDYQPPPEIIARKIAGRYGRQDWTERR
jgi:lipoate-protein ligase A